MKYSPERREAVLKKMMPPGNKTISRLAAEEGISEATLVNWRKQAREKGLLLPDGNNGPEAWCSRDKFAAVVETAALNETALSEYCRKKGLYPEQIRHWRCACEDANDWDRAHNRRLRAELKEERKRSRDLERDLNRKEKALAEAAALLMLRKKLQAIWADNEGE